MNTTAIYQAEALEAPRPAGTALIYLGNADLVDSCQHVPTEVRPGSTPLPIYPSPQDLAAIRTHR